MKHSLKTREQWSVALDSLSTYCQDLKKLVSRLPEEKLMGPRRQKLLSALVSAGANLAIVKSELLRERKN